MMTGCFYGVGKELTMICRRTIIAFSLLIFLGGTAPVLGAGPTEAVQGKMEQLISILDDPRFRDPGARGAQKEEIRRITRQIFDFTEISMRALGRNWRTLSSGEKGEFREVFTELLENTYISKIQDEYSDEKVVYLEQQMASDNVALVRTKVIRESVDVPVDYSMRLKNGSWRIYDVRVEGVSLVKNYRTQFAKILAKESPAQLIQRLRNKVAKQREGKEESG
jgi:phospholipid transport system substrate-binding protein